MERSRRCLWGGGAAVFPMARFLPRWRAFRGRRRALSDCLADCLAECQHEAVAVLDDHLSLAVNPILRTLQDLCTALAEVGGEVVDAVHVQVDIISFAAALGLCA